MRRINLLSTGASSIALALIAVPAAAQEQVPGGTIPTQQDQTEAQVAEQGGPTASEEPEGEDIVITGSRIARPEFDFPNPVTSVTQENLVQSGRTNITDLLSQTPALIGSSTSADNAGSNAGFGTTGANLLNLRNLGTNRTLVLVNGRRHVAGLPGSAAVDINTIPTALIERVDVLTGGSSAVYGADGVSGVVNFVLRRDFEGIDARAQAGISERGDAGNRFLSIVGGKNFAEGRGNVALAYEFNEDDRVNSFDRSRYGNPLEAVGIVRNPADFPDDPNVPDRLPFNNLRYADSSRDGAVDLGQVIGGVFVPGAFDGLPDFTGTGGVYDRGRLLPGSGGLTQGGSSTPLAGYQGDLAPKVRRHNVNALASFEASDALRVFAEGKYVNTYSYSIAQPTFDFFTFVAEDNAFLQDRFGAAAAGGALLSRDNFDLGIRGETIRRETYRGVIGADGRISDHARYELSFTYGETITDNRSDNFRLSDRYFAALDAVRDPATGQIVCRSNLFPNDPIDPNNFGGPAVTFTPGAGSGCAPLNLFGEGVASQAALDFVTVDLTNRSKVSQTVVSGSLSGDFGQFFELPGGPIAFALGGEYRRETSDFVSDDLLQQGVVADIGQILPERGSFDVKEAFAELNVPLLKDVPFADTLAFGAAIRLSDYSTVGSTTTWKVDGVYAPIQDLRIRATYSEAVRAPNVSELFSPRNGTFSFIDDPCDPENLPEGTQFRVANCTTLLTGLGIDPASFSPTSDPTATVSLPGFVAGNRDLQEETARTWTAGAVLRPRFLPGLSVSFDWYDIQLKDAVSTPTAQDLVDLCVDQPTLDNVFCQNVGRDPTTGYVNDYTVAPANVAAFNTSGADIQVNYAFEVSPDTGKFNLRLNAGYLDTLNFVPTPGGDVDDDREEAFAPKWSGTADLTWTLEPVTLNYGLNYYSATRRYTTEQVTANPDIAESRFLWFKERWEHDAFVSFNVDDRFTFYTGVNNLFDQKPDVASTAVPVSFIGRYFYAGARMRLGQIF